jgi:hypothetical protein
MHPTWAETTLSDLETTAFSQQDVFDWNPYIGELHF